MAGEAEIGKVDAVPHVWLTTDDDGNSCRHLTMGEKGALQAHLLHHGMLSYDKQITAVDEGKLSSRTERSTICFDPHCLMYALSFPDKSI